MAKSKNPLDLKWKARGKCLKVARGGTVNRGTQPVSVDRLIDIKERQRSFSLPGYENADAAGIPIDANLAVNLIRNLHLKLKDKFYKFMYPEKFADVPITRDDRDTLGKWLRNLLLQSRAISVDKNALLKIISQPGCEGVRFYLCLRSEGSKAIDKPGILSFVMVGINALGSDLEYVYSDKVRDGVQSDRYQVDNVSLTSEYAYPPPPPSILKTKGHEYYVLGEYAWGDFYKYEQ